MPGSPATTPRYGLPRYAQTDAAVFSTDINPILDALDNSAKLTELQAETARAEAAEAAEAAARTAAITAEQTDRASAVTAEASARRFGDRFVFVHVATMDDETSPPQAAGSVVGHGPALWVPDTAGQSVKLVGAVARAMFVPTGTGAVPSVYKVQTDHGHSDGSLATVTGLATVQPPAGRYTPFYATSGGSPSPLALDLFDTVAVVLVTPGQSKGCSVGLWLERDVS